MLAEQTTSNHLDMDNVMNIEQQSSEELEKQAMLAVMEEESKKFKRALADYHALTSPNLAAYLKVNSDLIASIDKIEAAGDWQKTLFLRNTIKPILAVRQKALDVQQQLTEEHSEQKIEKKLSVDQTKIFITVYQSQGHNLGLWESQLRSLSSYVQGRPIYAEEDAIRQALRAKLDQVNDAYVVVAIDRSSIMQGTHHQNRMDRYGHKLLTLMPGAVRPDNIIEFVHQGKHYDFNDQQLILKA